MKKITNIINNNVDSLKYLYTAGGSVNRDLNWQTGSFSKVEQCYHAADPAISILVI